MTNEQVLALLDKAPQRHEGITFMSARWNRVGWLCGVPGHSHVDGGVLTRKSAWRLAVGCLHAAVEEVRREERAAVARVRALDDLGLGDMAGHCCFAGCTLVTCAWCGRRYCVRGMHACAELGGRDGRDALGRPSQPQGGPEAMP